MVLFQRLESAAILVFLLLAYNALDLSWLWLVLLVLLPDISMAGYLKNPKIGALIYNIGHSYFAPVVFLILGFYLESNLLVAAPVIWAIHIAADRMLGFGLKLGTGFKDTHLGKL